MKTQPKPFPTQKAILIGVALMLFYLVYLWGKVQGLNVATSIPQPSIQPRQIATPTPDKKVELIKVDNKATEKNSVWWKYSWLVTLRNNTSQAQSTVLTLKWVDVNNLVIEKRQKSILLKANEEQTFNDYELVSLPVAADVNELIAELSW